MEKAQQETAEVRAQSSTRQNHSVGPSNFRGFGEAPNCLIERSFLEKGGEETEAVAPGHHFAAPEVEEWAPHPYEIVGTHRKESLKGDLPEEKKAEQPPAAE